MTKDETVPLGVEDLAQRIAMSIGEIEEGLVVLKREDAFDDTNVPHVLAIDKSHALTVVGLKNEMVKVYSFIAFLEHYEWFVSNRKLFEEEYPFVNPDTTLRLIIVAPLFSTEVITIAEFLRLPLLLVEFTAVKTALVGGDDLLFEAVGMAPPPQWVPPGTFEALEHYYASAQIELRLNLYRKLLRDGEIMLELLDNTGDSERMQVVRRDVSATNSELKYLIGHRAGDENVTSTTTRGGDGTSLIHSLEKEGGARTPDQKISDVSSQKDDKDDVTCDAEGQQGIAATDDWLAPEDERTENILETRVRELFYQWLDGLVSDENPEGKPPGSSQLPTSQNPFPQSDDDVKIKFGGYLEQMLLKSGPRFTIHANINLAKEGQSACYVDLSLHDVSTKLNAIGAAIQVQFIGSANSFSHKIEEFTFDNIFWNLAGVPTQAARFLVVVDPEEQIGAELVDWLRTMAKKHDICILSDNEWLSTDNFTGARDS